MENTWFYAAGETSVGPLSLADLTAILSRVSGAHSVLVWREGFRSWVRADSVAELALCLLKPPPLPIHQRTEQIAPAIKIRPDDQRAASHVTSRPDNLHPWRRYFARIMDLYIFILVFFFILGLIFPEFFQGPQTQGSERANDYAFTVLGSGAYVLFEAICLNTFGGTFGKFLYGVGIALEGERHIPFPKALKRALSVWVRGLGFGIPIVSLFTLSVAYRTLSRERQTSWDRDFHFSITPHRLSVFRWLCIGVAWLLLFCVVLILIAFGRRA